MTTQNLTQNMIDQSPTQKIQHLFVSPTNQPPNPQTTTTSIGQGASLPMIVAMPSSQTFGQPINCQVNHYYNGSQCICPSGLVEN
jgi:hypothetical protein